MDWISDPQIWLSLVTLTALEIVLGIDNLVFVAILAGRLPPERRSAGRRIGLLLALGTRVGLLFTLVWMIGMTAPLFALLGMAFSWRDLILMAGGMFLIGKGTLEIHHHLEAAAAPEQDGGAIRAAGGFIAVVIQIAVMDIVFSLDSVITAIGMARHVEVMVAAIVVAIAIMVLASDAVSGFIDRHPTVRMLALAFLLLIGTALVADGLDFHIPKGYIYFAMGFAVFVEALNMTARRRQAPGED